MQQSAMNGSNVGTTHCPTSNTGFVFGSEVSFLCLIDRGSVVSKSLSVTDCPQSGEPLLTLLYRLKSLTHTNMVSSKYAIIFSINFLVYKIAQDDILTTESTTGSERHPSGTRTC